MTLNDLVCFRWRKKVFSFRAGIYLDENTKQPVEEITGLLKWCETGIVKAYSYEEAISKFRKIVEVAHPELKNYLWIF